MDGKYVPGVLKSKFQFSSGKQVVYQSNLAYCVGVFKRILQLLIIIALFCVVIFWERSYRVFEDVVGESRYKVKGVAYTNLSTVDPENLTVEDTAPYNRAWDAADYVIPVQMKDAFFIMTNMVITENQTQGECPEDFEIKGASCTHDDNCTADDTFTDGNGVLTGRCVPYPGENLMTCQIRAWCPTERDVKPGPRNDRPVLYDAAKFTVFIKNPVQYPTLGHRQTNVLQTDDGDVFLKNCHFDPSNETLQFCPIFGIGEMVEWAGQDFEQMAMKGGSIAINIDWTCHLTSNSICIPKYSFKRIDSVNGLGHNFRFSYKYKDDGVEYRTLTKAYGIMFEITITGQGSRFSFWKMLVSVGALLTYLSIAACLEKGLFGLTLTLPCSDKSQKEYVSDRTTEVVKERVNWTCTRENWGKFCKRRPCSEQDSADEVYDMENRDATTSTS